jgi:UDP-N-acetylmuramyl pentapeptide phosphotransferase/UDP-N-acetylglucosamine-1-phosphate transferase
MLAAAFGVWLLGAVIPRLDIPGFDTLLKWAPFAIAFTMFAVGGVANAINIIDGYNGLAAGHAVIVLTVMAWVSALVGDDFLFTSALAMIGALLGWRRSQCFW